ncbi:hypothetical protein OAM75_02350 [Gammaproteobacteria bacterium]|nr:hypothetical protein [Gammaproteobacteria bacterium]
MGDIDQEPNLVTVWGHAAEEISRFAIYTSPPSLALSACTGLASGLAKSNSSDAESLFSQLASQQSAD